MATIEDFVATWSSDLASPPVVLTPNTHGRETRSTWIRQSPIINFFSGSRQIYQSITIINRRLMKTHESDLEKGRDIVIQSLELWESTDHIEKERRPTKALI